MPVLLLTCVVGCNLGSPEDPNAPVGRVASASAFRRMLQGASDMLNERVAQGEITDEQAQTLMKNYAEDLVDEIDMGKVNSKEAWEYADMFITAQMWEKARDALKVAVDNAPNEDRRVNDTLRLARVQAELGETQQSLETARRVFDAPDNETAPILPAVLLEIAPVVKGKGHDIALASLLEDAIRIHESTRVDATSPAGAAFMMAKPTHIRNAWLLVEKLYLSSNRPDLAKRARDRQFDGYIESKML